MSAIPPPAHRACRPDFEGLGAPAQQRKFCDYFLRELDFPGPRVCAARDRQYLRRAVVYLECDARIEATAQECESCGARPGRSQSCRRSDARINEVIAVFPRLRRSARTLNLTPAGTQDARVVEWQTRQFEGLVVAIPCGFKSRPAHHRNLDSLYLT